MTLPAIKNFLADDFLSRDFPPDALKLLKLIVRVNVLVVKWMLKVNQIIDNIGSIPQADKDILHGYTDDILNLL